MQYRLNPKNGDRLSALGFGCMRFTRHGAAIDQEKASREMKRALDLGVNYFDTAYVYSGSEACLGQFMKEYGLLDPRGFICILSVCSESIMRSTNRGFGEWRFA